MKISIKGKYKADIKLQIFKAKQKTKNVIFIVHGLFADSGGPYSKTRLLGNTIIKENIGNVVYFSSSRDWSVYIGGEWDTQVAAFKDKTFGQEADDLREAFDYILNNSQSLFGIEKSALRFTVVANSMGGTVVSTLSDRFELIDKIVLAGSGISYDRSDLPILSTLPTKNEIIKSAKKFTGGVLSLVGENDTVVSRNSQDELFKSFANATSKQIVVKGADHSFEKINGKNTRLAHQIYADTIVKFLTS